MNKNRYTVGSLYAGVGGICLGFKQAGYQLGWANDNDPRAALTYQANFPHRIYVEDILEVDETKLPKVDIITAGFPCQPFSIAGRQEGFEDERGNHFFKIMRFVDAMRPKVIFLENVKNLTSHDKGKTFRIIESAIKRRGYTFDYKVMNTCEYGNLPQNRERVYMVCFDKKLVGNNFKFEFPDKIELNTHPLGLRESWSSISEEHYYRQNRPMYDMLVEAMTEPTSVYQWRRKYVRENKSGVCPTLTANMGTGGHNVPLIKTQHGIRRLTPRECFNFQGFPKDFELPVLANSHLYKQAGNSVSVPVIKRLAENIMQVLNGNS